MIAGLLFLSLISTPQDTVLHVVLQRAFLQSFEQGRSEFLKARETRARGVTARLLPTVASYLLASGDSVGALAVLELNVETYQRSTDAHESLGRALLVAGRLEEAAAAYHASLAIDAYSPNNGKRLDWIDGLIIARARPVAVPDAVFERYVGRYGPYLVVQREASLTVQTNGAEPLTLLPLSPSLFAVEGVTTLRLWFVAPDGGPAMKVIVLHFDGGSERWPREDG